MDKAKEILRKQLELLAEESKKKCSPADLCLLTNQMIELCRFCKYEFNFL